MANAQLFYLLEESEAYQEKKFLESLRKKTFGETKNPDITTFDLKTSSFDDVMGAANTFSMFSSNRMIFVQQHKDLKEDDEEALLKYIDAPNPTTTIVWKTKKLDKRKRFAKQIVAKKVLQSFPVPKPQDMPSFIDEMSASLAITLDRDAKGAMIEAIGANLSQTFQELEKLKLYAYPETKITKKHVDAIVLKTSGDDVFAFTDQVIQKNLGKAYQTLSHLMAEGTVPLVLLSMLARHYRILLKIHDGLSRKIPPMQMASYAALPPFLVQRYMDQAKRVKKEECQHAIFSLQGLDRDFKSTGLSNKFLLERALLKLSGPVSSS